jgi:hypothetical protein
MRGFYIDHRALPDDASLSRELAQHICIRGARGLVVVVTDQPKDLLATTKKQWHALIRLVQRERSSTLKAARITELSNQIDWMQRLAFTSKIVDELPENGVVFATAADLIRRPPICSTLYITQTLSAEEFHLVTSWLVKNSVVVIYDLTSSVNQ